MSLVGTFAFEPAAFAQVIRSNAGFARTITVNRSAPVIVANSVRITNRTSSGFNVELSAFSTPRDLVNAIFSFQPSQGSELTGTSFTVSLAAVASAWFADTTGLQNGGSFHLTAPFAFTGDINALGTVSVILTNSAGDSVSVNGS